MRSSGPGTFLVWPHSRDLIRPTRGPTGQIPCLGDAARATASPLLLPHQNTPREGLILESWLPGSLRLCLPP